MRLLLLLACMMLVVPPLLTAQNCRQTSVLLSATVDKQPSPRITLTWDNEPNAISYQVARKLRGEAQWALLKNLDGDADSYVDNAVQPGMMYEYFLLDSLDYNGTIIEGFGYITAGLDVPPVHSRGNVLLLVDSTMAEPLASELDRLVASLYSEGWNVTRRDVERAEDFNKDAVQRTKAVIKNWYTANNNASGTILLFGRVAVPYSGLIYQGKSFAIDGHEDHHGAWPADLYYADMGNEAGWLDVIDETTPAREANKNRPGDGKYDNIVMVNYLAHRIGRVDFYNMGSFGKTETELLRAYLDKDNAYRSGQMKVKMRGLIDDNFGYFNGEAFARSGWVSFSPLVGRDNVQEADWFTTLDTAAYIWAYGCGGGTYTSAGGVGNTGNFVETPVNAVFTMLFGSYFGDWDSPNNFLRAGLASSSSVLTCAWAGRPYWFFHSMAMGETTGDCALQTQNSQIYAQGSFGNCVHVALMGDPTLRMRYKDVAAPANLVVHMPWRPTDKVELEWSAPVNGTVEGYYVYRQVENGPVELLTSSPVTATMYQDSPLLGKSVTYIVRATALVQSPSGTFYDLSNRLTATNTIVLGVDAPEAPALAAGLRAECGPNPARESVGIDITLASHQQVDIGVFSVTGERIQSLESRALTAGAYHYVWNLHADDGAHVPAGIYYVHITAGTESLVKKVVVLE